MIYELYLSQWVVELNTWYFLWAILWSYLHKHGYSECASNIFIPYIEELVQERRNSIANTLELCFSWTNP